MGDKENPKGKRGKWTNRECQKSVKKLNQKVVSEGTRICWRPIKIHSKGGGGGTLGKNHKATVPPEN